MERQCEHIHLEHDGKLLLVDMDGNGPAIPKKGRAEWGEGDFLIRLPTPGEAEIMGLRWCTEEVAPLCRRDHRVPLPEHLR